MVEVRRLIRAPPQPLRQKPRRFPFPKFTDQVPTLISIGSTEGSPGPSVISCSLKSVYAGTETTPDDAWDGRGCGAAMHSKDQGVAKLRRHAGDWSEDYMGSVPRRSTRGYPAAT